MCRGYQPPETSPARLGRCKKAAASSHLQHEPRGEGPAVAGERGEDALSIPRAHPRHPLSHSPRTLSMPWRWPRPCPTGGRLPSRPGPSGLSRGTCTPEMTRNGDARHVLTRKRMRACMHCPKCVPLGGAVRSSWGRGGHANERAPPHP